MGVTWLRTKFPVEALALPVVEFTLCKKVGAWLALCCMLFLPLGSSVVLAQSPECYSDTQACMSACINAYETSSPGLDCAKTCFKFDEVNKNYCFTRYFKQPEPTRPKWKFNSNTFQQLSKACDQSECEPVYQQQLHLCTQNNKKDANAQLDCMDRVATQSFKCLIGCMERAQQGARVPSND
jgi:hypothetical protein